MAWAVRTSDESFFRRVAAAGLARGVVAAHGVDRDGDALRAHLR
jgi:hypothetical protein